MNKEQGISNDEVTPRCKSTFIGLPPTNDQIINLPELVITLTIFKFSNPLIFKLNPSILRSTLIAEGM